MSDPKDAPPDLARILSTRRESFADALRPVFEQSKDSFVAVSDRICNQIWQVACEEASRNVCIVKANDTGETMSDDETMKLNKGDKVRILESARKGRWVAAAYRVGEIAEVKDDGYPDGWGDVRVERYDGSGFSVHVNHIELVERADSNDEEIEAGDKVREMFPEVDQLDDDVAPHLASALKDEIGPMIARCAEYLDGLEGDYKSLSNQERRIILKVVKAMLEHDLKGDQ